MFQPLGFVDGGPFPPPGTARFARAADLPAERGGIRKFRSRAAVFYLGSALASTGNGWAAQPALTVMEYLQTDVY